MAEAGNEAAFAFDHAVLHKLRYRTTKHSDVPCSVPTTDGHPRVVILYDVRIRHEVDSIDACRPSRY